MINGYGCYLIYLAIKSHFINEKYDYFKYQGRVNANVVSYNRRPDKYFFEKLAKILKKEDAVERYFVSNFVYDNTLWIGDALSEGSHDNYVGWVKRIQSIQYTFKQNIKLLKDLAEQNECDIQDLFISEDGQHPTVLKLFLKKKIVIETLVVFDSLFNLFETWDKQIKEKTVWPEMKKKCEKYEPFLYNYLNKNQIKSLNSCAKKELMGE